MIINTASELDALKESGKRCAYIRDEVAKYIKVGMSTLEIDKYAEKLFVETEFISAPIELYNFPGNICISVNSCVAHGVPSKDIIIQPGGSVNIDVCGSYKGFYSDCGKSVVIGENVRRQAVCECARAMLEKGLDVASHKILLRQMGKAMEVECKARGFYPIKKLTGHGIGKTLHENPSHIHCHNAIWDGRRFSENMVVAIETFVSTNKYEVYIGKDGWSWIAPDNADTAQFEHTVVITKDKPIIITE